jgi:glycosyltransferase involved in cell wall biosynthesis
MKIVISNYRYYLSGGPERYLFTIMDALQAHGHEVLPFSLKSPFNVPTAYESEFLSPVSGNGAAQYYDYRKDLPTLLKVLDRQFYSLEAFYKAWSFGRRHGPDLIYSLKYMNKMSPSVPDGFRASGKPVVVRISDFGMICPQTHLYSGNQVCNACVTGSLFNAFRKRCVMNSRTAGLVKGAALATHRLLKTRDRINAYVFPSRFTMQKFVEAGFDEARLHYIPTPVDARNIVPEYTADGHILYFGRVVKEKGVQHLLAAYRALSGDKPALKVVGISSVTPYVKELTEEYREATFLPFIGKEELPEHIRKALCVVIPSVWYDNLPNVLLEAYAYGKPVIAPGHGCFPEVVKDGETGLLFAPGDVEDLREKLAWAIAHPSAMKAMGQRARAYVEAEFGVDRHYEALMAVFQSVL